MFNNQKTHWTTALKQENRDLQNRNNKEHAAYREKVNSVIASRWAKINMQAEMTPDFKSSESYLGYTKCLEEIGRMMRDPNYTTDQD